ncbi:MAG: hypothetical protein JXJ20_03725 [Anaerolineae bacterium]|nr:hypothetical protein [Anaerolineae bacterium]
MMKPPDVYTLCGEAFQTIVPQYQPGVQQKVDELKLKGNEWYFLIVSQDFEPETISTARFIERGPYGAARAFEKGLKALVDKGLLEPAGDGEYRITDAGHEAIDSVLDTMYARLAELKPLPVGDLKRLADLLLRVVNACVDAPEPENKLCITVNRSSDPGEEGLPLLRLLQYVSDLRTFRDDAHMAAWRPYGVSGPAWEAFTFIWRDEVHTPDELAEKLSYRALSADDYAQALDTLVGKGWLAASDGQYVITEQGKALRQEAEDVTDRYFYAPWAVLSGAELVELAGLLTRLRDSLPSDE